MAHCHPGLSLNSASGLLDGTPTTPNTYQITVQVRDSSSQLQTASQNYTIRIANADALIILTTGLPDGQQGEPYNADLWIDYSVRPNLWLITNGALPPGLSIDFDPAEPATGYIDGVATQSGDYGFVVTVSNNSTGQSDNQSLSIHIQ